MNQIWASPSSVSWPWEVSHRCELGERRLCIHVLWQGVFTIYFFSYFCSLDLFEPDPGRAISIFWWIADFLLRRVDRIQIMMGSSCLMAAWCPKDKHSCLYHSLVVWQSCFRNDVWFSAVDGMVLLQNPMGLPMTLLLALIRDFPGGLSTTHTSGTIASAVSHGPSRSAACVTAWICCRILSLLKTSTLLYHLTKGLEHYFQVGNMLPPRHDASWLVVEGARY